MIKKLFLILFFILINSFFIYALEDPVINISLDNSQYIQNDKLTGNIVLTINHNIEDKDLEVRFGPSSDITKLSELLNKLGITYEKTNGLKELVPLKQPDDSIFFPPLVQELGISVPKDTQDFSGEGSIGGWAVDNNVPKFPYLDIGGDGLIEWSYLGDLIGWTNYINSNDLGNIKNYVKVLNPDTLVCQNININSKSRSINVTVNYNDVSQGAKVKAKLITIPDNSKKSFGTSSCELSQPDPSNPTGSCVITFNEIPKVRQGNYLLCAFVDRGTITNPVNFTIATDNRQTNKAYICIHNTDGGYFDCSPNTNYNYLIKASLPIYNGSLDKISTTFADGATEIDLNNSLMSYLSSNACSGEGENCIIPIEVGSLTSGRLYFNGFSIQMKRGGTSESAVIQKLRRLPDVMTKVDAKTLENGQVKIIIPIKVLYNFTVPEVTQYQVIPLEITYGSTRVIAPVEVYQSILTNKKDVNTTISNILSLLDTYSNQDVKDILNKAGLNVGTLKSTFLGYQSRLDSIESNTTETQDNKDKEKLALLNDVENSKKDVPSYFYQGNKIFNIPTIPPDQSDIKDSILGNQNSDNVKEYILSLQSSISISSNAKFFSIKTFGNKSYDYTTITRIVAGAPNDAFIVDIIPKSIAESASNLILDQTTTAIESDPIIKKQLTSGAGTLSYLIKGDVTDKVTDINTLVVSLSNVPSGTNTKPAVYNIKCGDGICSTPLEDEKVCPEDCTPKRNWSLIIIAIIVLVIGIFYINFYNGPGSLFNIKQRLFHSETDKTNLINYIRRSLKYKSKEQITNVLLSKGWSHNQIDSAFKEAQKNKK